jgi:tellurite resistance protein TehA-like permease
VLRTRPAPAVTVPAEIGAAIMGTGIVSVALRLDGERAVSAVLFVVAAVVGVVALVLVAAVAVSDRRRIPQAAAAPASLTAVAAACVLGARLAQSGARTAGAILLACAAVAWGPLLRAVLRAWRRPARGEGFLVAVSAQSLAVLCAVLDTRRLAGAAVALLVAGLVLYAFAAASFDLGELRRGRGDQWVAGGALAIAALAAATAAAPVPGARLADALRSLSLLLWALAMLWLPVLVAGELRRPRTAYDPRRWGTVFPVGMYAAMSFAVGRAESRHAIVTFARGWTWVALVVWALVAAASARRAVALARTRSARR